MSQRLTLKDHAQETKLFIRRTIVLSVWAALLMVLIFGRLIYLQVYQHSLYTTLSNQNQLEWIPIKPDRGLIYDRNGVLLAENIPVFSLELTPNRIKDIPHTINKLRQFIPITQDEIDAFHKQAKQHRPFEPVPLRLNITEKERATFAVNQYRFPGVNVKARLIRHYPLGEALSHVLGYVGRINETEIQQIDPINYSATNFIGKLGIEKYYEKALHGKVGYERVEIDASGRILRVMLRTPPVPGNNIYITIDSQLEIAIEKILGKLRGAVVAIKPDTGEVLALVSAPSYDPNQFVQGISKNAYAKLRNSPNQPLYNRSIRGQYPFASTIKPFIALEVLDSEIISLQYRIWDPGWFRLPNSSHIYRDWKRGGHGWVNLRRAILVSCDTFFYTVSNLLGIKPIHKILTKFGFGIPTHIDMDEELPGLVPSPTWKRRMKGASWYPGDTLISGIGQGFMLTTPVQLASGVATLSKKGVRHRPHLLLRQEMPNKLKIAYKTPGEFPVILKHPYAWDFVIDAMRRVITDHGGTGYRFGRNAPYPVAGKTGTGQVFSAKFHAPFDDKNLPEKLRDHSLFIAFSPIENPQIALAVIIENSKEASIVARKVLDYYLLPQAREPRMFSINR